MKDSAIYRKAARIIADGEFPHHDGACIAITKAVVSTGILGSGCSEIANPLKEELRNMYMPMHSPDAYWLEPLGKEGRILALCFMAAIAESEGK